MFPRSTRLSYSLSEYSEASKTCLEIESFSSYMPTYHLVIIWLHKFMITGSGWCPCWVCVGEEVEYSLFFPSWVSSLNTQCHSLIQYEQSSINSWGNVPEGRTQERQGGGPGMAPGLGVPTGTTSVKKILSTDFWW